ncbi:shikimate dehydrogenase [Thermoplasma sp.]|uniref:shikimate dehydrogenase n=1 Tax=Thermoplasma sp. TaxID=1973142 RepID=UPI0025D968D0|nr:shikimate dehydrogenase [Thermoplasma sp.]
MSGDSIVGLIGHPVSHSIGQIVYNRIFQDLGMDSVYLAMDVHRDILPLFMIRSGFLRAFNVTIPHKVSVIPFLDSMDPIATETHSVNLVVRIDGAMKGYNTDYFGIEYALKAKGIDVRGKRAVVAGSGGIARTAIRYLLDHGAGGIDVLTRDVRRAQENLAFSGINICDHINSEYDMYINCTPIGTFGEGDPFSTVRFESDSIGIDLVYNPMRTPFLMRMENAGGKIVSGIDIFIGQGLRTLELVFGISPEEMFRKYALEALDEIRKI